MRMLTMHTQSKTIVLELNYGLVEGRLPVRWSLARGVRWRLTVLNDQLVARSEAAM
jgi:hypothetical protein